MAITTIEYALFQQMRTQNALPLGGDILELGEANWYGDVAIDVLAQDIYRFAAEAERQTLFQQLDEIVQAKRPGILFETAKIFWRTFLQPASMAAIDFHGTADALKQDLNQPLDLPHQFHIVLNLGTAEHVFNIAQVFKSIHDHTLPSGLMMHGLPFSGWVDHGFFNFNSTFYWDLAAANGYEMLLCVYAELKPLKLVQLVNREAILELARNGEIGQNSLLYVVMRKPAVHAEFRIPIQGYYAATISPGAAQAWKTLR